jgi:hypothetical protein
MEVFSSCSLKYNTFCEIWQYSHSLQFSYHLRFYFRRMTTCILCTKRGYVSLMALRYVSSMDFCEVEIFHRTANFHNPCFTNNNTISEINNDISGNARRKETTGKTNTWVDKIKMDLRETGWGGMDWIDQAQNRYQWRVLVNTVMNLRVA